MSESRIISQCAPTLAGIKTGSLFPHPYDSKGAGIQGHPRDKPPPDPEGGCA